MSDTQLTGSVGLGGMNLPADVVEVRFLLEMHIFSNVQLRDACWDAGLLDPTGLFLKEDPDIMSAAITGSAVVQFQHIILRWRLRSCDGRVDPGPRGKTWNKLTGALGPANTVAMDVAPAMPAISDALSNAGFKAYNQGAYKSETLGYKNKKGGDVTISQQGCFLCVLTMAATGIGKITSAWPKGVLPKDLTPVHANRIAKKHNCYSSAGLNPFTLAPLLGMSIKRYGKGKWDTPLPANPTDHVDGHIGSGGVVAAHVDYKDKHRDHSVGDHWILVTNKSSDSGLKHYDAIDPAGGVWMGMSKNGASNMRDNDFLIEFLADPTKTYDKAYLFGIPSSKSSQSRQKAQGNYRMVRYCLLSPA